MEQDERRNEVKEHRDPETGKLLCRFDPVRQEIEFKTGRRRWVWVSIRVLLDNEPTRR